MITQVCGPSVVSVAKDPRRKSQRVRFNQHSNIPYKHNYNTKYDATTPESNALKTSVFIALGAVLLCSGYFLMTGSTTR